MSVDKPKRTTKTMWKPGQSGNPRGKEALPPELLLAKRMSVAEFMEYAYKFGELNEPQLRGLEKHPACGISLRALAQAWLDMIDPDPKVRHMARVVMWDRLLGKAKEHIEVTGDNFDLASGRDKLLKAIAFHYPEVKIEVLDAEVKDNDN